MQEDTNFKRKAVSKGHVYYLGDKTDPVYRKRRTGGHSRANANRITIEKRQIGKTKRQLIKRNTMKEVIQYG